MPVPTQCPECDDSLDVPFASLVDSEETVECPSWGYREEFPDARAETAMCQAVDLNNLTICVTATASSASYPDIRDATVGRSSAPTSAANPPATSSSHSTPAPASPSGGCGAR